MKLAKDMDTESLVAAEIQFGKRFDRSINQMDLEFELFFMLSDCRKLECRFASFCRGWGTDSMVFSASIKMLTIFSDTIDCGSQWKKGLVFFEIVINNPSHVTRGIGRTSSLECVLTKRIVCGRGSAWQTNCSRIQVSQCQSHKKCLRQVVIAKKKRKKRKKKELRKDPISVAGRTFGVHPEFLPEWKRVAADLPRQTL